MALYNTEGKGWSDATDDTAQPHEIYQLIITSKVSKPIEQNELYCQKPCNSF